MTINVHKFLDDTRAQIANINTFLNNPNGYNRMRMEMGMLPVLTSILGRPIGILNKEFGYAQATVSRNIGSGIHDYDGIGTPIGMLADPYYNIKYSLPWFKLDEQKNQTNDYIDYINTYYFGTQNPLSFASFANTSNKDKYFTTQSLKLENNRVGAIHVFDPTLYINPNGLTTDTELGRINQFYLQQTLNNGDDYALNRRGSSYVKMADSTSVAQDVSTRFGISDGAYDLFGAYGDFGRSGNPSPLLKDYRYDLGSLGFGKLDDNYKMPSIKYVDSGGFRRPNITRVVTANQGTTHGNNQKLFDDSSKQTRGFINASIKGLNLLYDKVNDTTLEHPLWKGASFQYGEAINSDSTLGDSYLTYAEFGQWNGNDGARALGMFSEGTGAAHDYYEPMTNDNSTRIVVSNTDSKKAPQDILNYTNEKFLKGDYDTIIAKFGTFVEGGNMETAELSLTQTALSRKYGQSHGRNLLKSTPTVENGYVNPYCRVWTYHHQYNKYKDGVRPFSEERDLYNNESYKAYRTKIGLGHLKERGVLIRETNLPRIAPTSKENLKRVMFSIENLAWKGCTQYLEVDGTNSTSPNGGRIMWFPPYNLKFDENVNVNWHGTEFIGRGEKIYTYVNTERSGTLSFTLLIDHPSIINQWRNAKSRGSVDTFMPDGVDDVNSVEQGILRFFAGCDILDPLKAPQPISPKIEPTIDDEPIPHPTMTDQIIFFVYYPNNYTGVDDRGNGDVYAVDYLISGVGAQKIKQSNGNVTDLRTSPNDSDRGYKGIGYEMGDNGISSGFVKGDVSTLTSITSDWAASGNKLQSPFIIPNSNNLEAVPQEANRGKSTSKNNWGYRVDTSTPSKKWASVSNEILALRNYVDYNSSKLNSSGYTKAWETQGGHILNEGEEGKVVSFASMYYACRADVKSESGGDETQKNRIKDILSNANTIITSVDYEGFASKHGYTEVNKRLSKQRAETIKEWLMSDKNIYHNKFTADHFKTWGEEKDPTIKEFNGDVNGILPKIYRCAKIIINYTQENIGNASENVDDNNVSISQSLLQNIIASAIGTTKDAISSIMASNQQTKKNNQEEYIASLSNANANLISVASTTTNYGNEYEFFKDLAKNDSFLHNKIVDKIKYFDPAFHSISPEGFNARLTFLHQCTRAGFTKGDSDPNKKSATNLAFGRPPVCILRIGDFIHTKIIIDSLSINYVDNQWDLNPEGIGVMPMMADIQIQFKYIGSQSLSEPIARLANALSFNYYANTEVYDGRSEIGEIK